MRILVTGSSGQVARALAERGAAAGVEALCRGRPELDLADGESIAPIVRAVKPDVIVSAAAYTQVDQAEDEPELAHAINAVAPGVLAEAAQEVGARLIHLSTDYVYDGSKDAPYVETDATGPRSVYGASKLAGEAAVREACPAHVILRTAWVYSPFGRNFVKTMLNLAGTRDTLSVVADQFGNPTSAFDIADAILAIVSRWRRKPGAGLGEIYHCAGEGDATWRDLARHALETSAALGGPHARVDAITTAQWPTKAVRPANSRLDCAKLARDFDWRAPHWRDSVNDVVRRLLSQPSAQE